MAVRLRFYDFGYRIEGITLVHGLTCEILAVNVKHRTYVGVVMDDPIIYSSNQGFIYL